MRVGPRKVVALNNGDEIKRIQELEENKRLLAAQREMYSTAKRFDCANALVCFAGPLFVTLIQLVSAIPSGALIAVWLLAMAAGLVLPGLSAGLVKKAAQVQQAFDSKVFGMPFENAGIGRGDVARYADRYYARCERKGIDPGLDDWYSVDLSGLEAGEAIARCQRQNAEWTRRLLLRSIGGEVAAAAVFGALLWSLVARLSVDPLSLTFLLSIVEWAIQRVARCLSTLRKVGNLSVSMSFDLSSEENVRRAQGAIYDYRSSSYIVSDFVYRLFKGRDDMATSRD